MIPTIQEDFKRLLEAIEENTEYIKSNNFAEGIDGVTPVIQLQHISEEMENLKFNLKSYGYDIDRNREEEK